MFHTLNRRPNRLTLRVETLDDRIVPDAVPVTDMTQLARLFPTHDGPTRLYLNFDGATNIPGRAVAAFTGSNQDKAEVLFRTAEIFAPFNVEVVQMFGAGNYDDANGSTTIFVGDDRFFDRVSTNAAGVVTRTDARGGFTPAAYMDYPTAAAPTAAPNSHAFDVAFVDPTLADPAVGGRIRNTDNTWIAQVIAHEAGHTFGLAHVLSNPVNDVMSYDDTNAFFANQTFTVTSLNFNPATGQAAPDATIQPQYQYLKTATETKVSDITTQNSYTFLRRVLGGRPAHAPRVVHADSVDSDDYVTFPIRRTPVNFSATGFLDVGDHRVFAFAGGALDHTVHVDLAPTDNRIIPTLQVYDGAGTLVQYAQGTYAAPGRFEVHVDVALQAGQTYQFVVGDIAANEAGGFTLAVDGSVRPYVLDDPNGIEEAPSILGEPNFELPPLQEVVLVPDPIGPVVDGLDFVEVLDGWAADYAPLDVTDLAELFEVAYQPGIGDVFALDTSAVMAAIQVYEMDWGTAVATAPVSAVNVGALRAVQFRVW